MRRVHFSFTRESLVSGNWSLVEQAFKKSYRQAIAWGGGRTRLLSLLITSV